MSTEWVKTHPRVVVLTVTVLITSLYPGAVRACWYEEPTIWGTIEAMSPAQLAGTLVLLGLLALCVAVAVSCGHSILHAVRQTRDYESRALSALFYSRIDEAIDVAALFPSSPVAAVVTASVERTPYRATEAPLRLKVSKPAFQRAVVAQTISLKRRLWVLSAIGWSSPVIGLAITLLPEWRYGTDRMLPFCFGLLIAAPALWFHKGLSAVVELLLQKTERISQSIIEQIGDQTGAPIDKQKDHRALFGSCNPSSNSITISGSVLPTLISKPSSSTRTI